MKKSIGPQTVMPVPVWIVGSYDQQGKANMMAAAWCGICNSQPPCITVSLRKARHSYNSILERQAYTVSVPSEEFVKEADYFGIASGEKHDKLAETGLTAVKGELVDAPYIKEFPMVVECKLLHHYDIGMHTMFVGEIMDVKVEETALDGDKVRADLLKPLIYTSKTYYGMGTEVAKAFSIGKCFAK
jgi:flavin reductase (DIM6/NTAB) family NADH-FMN oxidoreductase RutF